MVEFMSEYVVCGLYVYVGIEVDGVCCWVEFVESGVVVFDYV